VYVRGIRRILLRSLTSCDRILCALRVSRRGYVMESGKIVLADTADALLRNPKVQHAYLGG
jgi:ABC-type branched-subunit amino acid transport system ATPase component